MTFKTFMAAAVLVAGLSGIANGHGDEHETVYGKPGDAKKPARVVQIVMREQDGKMIFIPTSSGSAGRADPLPAPQQRQVDHDSSSARLRRISST